MRAASHLSELPWPTQLYILILGGVAISMNLFLMLDGPVLEFKQLGFGLTLGVLMMVAWLFPLPFGFKTKLYLDTSVVIALILLCPPGLAMAIAGVSTLIAQLIRRQPGDQAVFNSGQIMLQAMVGSLILSASGWDIAAPTFTEPVVLLGIVAAGAAMYAVNALSVAVVIGLQSGGAWRNVGNVAVSHARHGECVAQIAQLGMGLIAAVLASIHPWMIALPLIPATVVYLALASARKLRQRLEVALRDSREDLAAAERIAQLGSWEWNLTTGEFVWSDQAFRIFGFNPQQFIPNFEMILRWIHPDDRSLVNGLIHDALYTGEAFSFDHRILQPDGTERILHQQGDIVADEAGQKVRLVGTLQDVTEHRQLQAQLAHRAFHDPLTDLPNRALLTDRIEETLARFSEEGQLFAVLFLDLDHFKLVNDTLGHDAGDQLLIEVTRRLKSCLRQSDTITRFGGDEFVILLDNLAKDSEIQAIAGRVQAAVEAPLTIDGQQLTVTTSIGIALPMAHHRSAADLLRDADVALYQAKGSGRACSVQFEATAGETALQHLTLEHDLRRALEQNEFEVHFQPVVALASREVTSIEALVRWIHPVHGLVSPGEFIPLAESTGLIVPIGRWVMEEAILQLRRWRDSGLATPSLAVSINLSARQLQEPTLVEDISRILWQTGIEPDAVILEITETAVIEDVTTSAARLQELSELGLRIDIDDFGTGYSSLAYLKHFPVTGLKIDRSFIMTLEQDAVDQALVRAIVAAAQALGLEVTAEGIETGAQADIVQDLGCDLGQGYFFAKPAPFEELELFPVSDKYLPTIYDGRDRSANDLSIPA